MHKKYEELIKQSGTDTSGKWMGVEHSEKLAELIVLDIIKLIKTDNSVNNHCAYTTYDKGVIDCVVDKIVTLLTSEFNIKKEMINVNS
jgi:hypothetical protein